MQALPEPAPREPVHTRAITTRGFLRTDGLWDLEAELLDTKAYSSMTSGDRFRAAGDPVHHMRIRLTIDDNFTVHAAVAAMPSTPFAECAPAADPFDGLVGAKIGPGWRKQVDAAMGGVRGCTHLREMLFNMATAAYQTIPSYQHRLRRQAGLPESNSDQPPYHLGKCIAWDFDGPVTARHYPKFAGWQPLKRRT